VRRGELYWANLTPRSGSEQTGRRPVLILSHNGFNETPGWRSIIVVPISTSSNQARRGPTIVCLPNGTAGLQNGSSVICHQVTTLDRRKLGARIGTLSSQLLAQVERALLAAVDIQ
jgi:mRNA interferase MazF